MTLQLINRQALRATVVAAPNSTGDQIAYPYPAVDITLVNTDTQYGIEYRTGADKAWQYLGKGTGAIFPAATTSAIYVRCVSDGGTAVGVEVSGADRDTTVLDGSSLALSAVGNPAGVKDRYAGAVIERRPPYRKRNYFVKRANVLDNMDGCAQTWTKGSNIGVFAADYDTTRVNTPTNCSLSFTCTTGFSTITRNFGAGAGIRPSDGALMIPFYISAIALTDANTPPGKQNCSVVIRLSTTNDFSAATGVMATAYNMSYANLNLREGWTDLMVSALDFADVNGNVLNNTGAAGWTYSGPAAASTGDAAADRTTNSAVLFQYMRLEMGGLQPTAFTSPVAKIGGVYQGGMSRANVLLNCDDGQKDTIDLLNVYMARRIALSIAAITGSVSGINQFMGTTRFQSDYARGLDVVSHTINHPVGGLPAVSAAQLKTELDGSRQWLLANQMPRVADVIAFPENAYGARELAAAAAAGYVAARGARPGWTPTIFGLDNALALGSRDVGGKTQAQARRALDAAQTYGCTVILYLHQIAFNQLSSIVYTSTGVTATYQTTLAVTAPAVGTVMYLRGMADPTQNVAVVLKTSSTTGFTADLVGATPGSPTATAGPLRCFSPTWPAAGGAPPANSLYWYLSDHISFANEIADRWNAGTITPITYADLLDNCTY